MRVSRVSSVAAAVVAGLFASTSAWAVVVNVDLASSGTPVTGVTISFETTTGEPIEFVDLADPSAETPPLVEEVDPVEAPPLVAETEPVDASTPKPVDVAPAAPSKPPVRTVVSNRRGKAKVDIPNKHKDQNIVAIVRDNDGRETRRQVALSGGVVNVAIDLPAATPPATTGPRPRQPQLVVNAPPQATPAAQPAPAKGCGIDPVAGCVEVSVGPIVSVIEQPATLGTGTAAETPVPFGDEFFGARFGSYIPRYGVDADFEVGIGPGSSFAGGGNAFIKGNFIYASGEQSAAGRAAVGVDGVGGVGYTFVVPGGAGTGIIGTAPGFGIESSAELRNDWTVASLSYGQVFDPFDSSGDQSDPDQGASDTKLQYTIGLQYERIGVRSSGRTDLTFGGVPFGGYSQTYEYTSTDQYFGVKLGLAVYHQLSPNWQVHAGANIVPGYHSGRSEFNLVSGVGGGATYDETFVDRSSNFTLGGGLEAGLSYLCDNGWGIDLVGYGDVLPQVTSFTMPSNPDQQSGAGYGSNHLLRGGITIRARFAF